MIKRNKLGRFVKGNNSKKEWREKGKQTLIKKGIKYNAWKIKKRIKKICLVCGKKFMVLPSFNYRKYCSHQCYAKSGVQRGRKTPWNRNFNKIKKQAKKMLGKNNPNWHDGISFEPYSPEFTDRLKGKIRKKYNYICQLCGDEILNNTKKKFLCVHHINYDKKDCREENLILLCNLCNSSVNKSREDWINYFQNKIRIQNG